MSVSVSGLRVLASGKLGMCEDKRSIRVIIVIRLSSASRKGSQLEKAKVGGWSVVRPGRTGWSTSRTAAASRWLSPGNPELVRAGECITVGLFNSGLGSRRLRRSFPAILLGATFDEHSNSPLDLDEA